MLDQLFDLVHEPLDIVQIVFLLHDALADLLNSVLVLLVKIFEGINHIRILESNEAVLQDREVEQFHLNNIVADDLVGQSFEHQDEVYSVQETGF